MSISLKEANETVYWLELLYETHYLDEKTYLSMRNDCDELIKMLVTIVKNARSKNY